MLHWWACGDKVIRHDWDSQVNASELSSSSSVFHRVHFTVVYISHHLGTLIQTSAILEKGPQQGYTCGIFSLPSCTRNLDHLIHRSSWSLVKCHNTAMIKVQIPSQHISSSGAYSGQQALLTDFVGLVAIQVLSTCQEYWSKVYNPSKHEATINYIINKNTKSISSSNIHVREWDVFLAIYH
jgi:hypothetical protein